MLKTNLLHLFFENFEILLSEGTFSSQWSRFNDAPMACIRDIWARDWGYKTE